MNLYSKKYSQNVAKATGYAGFRNRRRLSLLNKLIPINKDDNVLEIGPNNCLLIDSFKNKAKSVTGLRFLRTEYLSRKREHHSMLSVK